MSSPVSEISKLLSILQMNDFRNPLMRMLWDNKNLNAFSTTCKQFEALFRPTLKASELLSCVLNPTSANLMRMNALLAEEQSADKSIILTRVYGKEFYFSRTQNQTLVRSNRPWPQAISPLEAAFKCGDFHLVRRLLAWVPVNHKEKALAQLLKAEAECDSDVPGSCLYEIRHLHEAYDKYLDCYFNNNSDLDFGEMYRTWGCVGEAQKNLSWFLLQVFCNPVPHDPIPDFNLEPPRDCLLYDRTHLDLDSIGGRIFKALHKAKFPDGVGVWVVQGGGVYNFPAFDTLYDVIQLNLIQIIESLQMEVNSLSIQERLRMSHQ